MTECRNPDGMLAFILHEHETSPEKEITYL